MGLATLSPSHFCCSSSPQKRLIGALLLPLIENAKVKEDTLTRFYQKASDLPLGENGFKSLRLLKKTDFKGDWIVCNLTLPRNANPEKIDYAPILPNVFLGSCCIETFLRTPKDQTTKRVLAELIKAYHGKNETLNSIESHSRLLEWDIEKIIEACLPLRFPPLLIAYVNFRFFNFACPSEIRLEGDCLPNLWSPHPQRKSSREFPVFSGTKAAMFAAMRAGRWQEADVLLEMLSVRVGSIKHESDQILCQCLLHILAEPVRERDLSMEGLQRRVNELPRVHRMVQARARSGRIHGATMKALKDYRAVLESRGSPMSAELIKLFGMKSKGLPRL